MLVVSEVLHGGYVVCTYQCMLWWGRLHYKSINQGWGLGWEGCVTVTGGMAKVLTVVALLSSLGHRRDGAGLLARLGGHAGVEGSVPTLLLLHCGPKSSSSREALSTFGKGTSGAGDAGAGQQSLGAGGAGPVDLSSSGDVYFLVLALLPCWCLEVVDVGGKGLTASMCAAHSSSQLSTPCNHRWNSAWSEAAE